MELKIFASSPLRSLFGRPKKPKPLEESITQSSQPQIKSLILLTTPRGLYVAPEEFESQVLQLKRLCMLKAIEIYLILRGRSDFNSLDTTIHKLFKDLSYIKPIEEASCPLNSILAVLAGICSELQGGVPLAMTPPLPDVQTWLKIYLDAVPKGGGSAEDRINHPYCYTKAELPSAREQDVLAPISSKDTSAALIKYLNLISVNGADCKVAIAGLYLEKFEQSAADSAAQAEDFSSRSSRKAQEGADAIEEMQFLSSSSATPIESDIPMLDLAGALRVSLEEAQGTDALCERLAIAYQNLVICTEGRSAQGIGISKEIEILLLKYQCMINLVTLHLDIMDITNVSIAATITDRYIELYDNIYNFKVCDEDERAKTESLLCKANSILDQMRLSIERCRNKLDDNATENQSQGLLAFITDNYSLALSGGDFHELKLDKDLVGEE